jgi:hypothetical protein
LLTATPYGATPSDVSEVMLGSILVTPVFLESDGREDVSLEDWTPSQITATKQKIEDAMAWWVETLANQGSVHGLQFVYDFTHADNPFETQYEPIDRVSDDFELYADEFLHAIGFGTPSQSIEDIHGFNDSQREKFDTNWAFTTFVVNSANDADGMFRDGGSFEQAFALPSRFMVVPSERPTRTFTHEAGHIFWGLDEYTGGGNFNEHRGYYDTQNLNAVVGNVPGFVQEDSIMAAGTAYFDAFSDHTSAASTLAIIGWQDSDNDGVFDLLDVPHELSVSASYNSSSGVIRILGDAQVGVLPNQNSEGNQSDLTINRVDELQYRLDNGDWTTAETFGTYQANMDVTMSGALGASSMQVRTVSIDSITGLVVTTSEVFTVQAGSPGSSVQTGIAGHVFQDVDSDGQRDPKEVPLVRREVQLVDDGGRLIALQSTVEPDGFSNGTTLNAAVLNGVTVTAEGLFALDGAVLANISTTNPTGGQVFVFQGFGRLETEWREFSGELVAAFHVPTGMVQLDAIASQDGEIARMEAFDAFGNSLGRFTTPVMTAGQRVTMTIADPNVQIKSIKAFGRTGHDVHLDSLVFGVPASTVTDSLGNYAFSYLPNGDYRVALNVAETVSVPVIGVHNVSIQVGSAEVGNDFGVVFDTPWQNPNTPFDVNADEIVTTTDLVNLVGDIFINGPRDLDQPTDAVGPPLFFDINADGRFSVADLAALLQNLLLKSSGGGEPADQGDRAAGGDTGSGIRQVNSASFSVRAAGEPTDTLVGNESPVMASRISDATTLGTTLGELPLGGLVFEEETRLDFTIWDPVLVQASQPVRRSVEPTVSDWTRRPERLPTKEEGNRLSEFAEWEDGFEVDGWLLDVMAADQTSETKDVEDNDSVVESAGELEAASKDGSHDHSVEGI